MFRHSRSRRTVAACLIALISVGQTAPAWGDDWVAQMRARWDNHKGVPSAEALAAEIQKLEKHIDWYGTIVAKQPDVWGQARLMKHRQEFEQQMITQLDATKFAASLQGSIDRTDQVFLSEALALGAAVSGTPAVQLPQSASTSQLIASRQAAATKAGVTGTQTAIATPTASLPSLIDDTPDKPIINRSTPASNTTPTSFEASTISLERTEFVDQLANYINHLNEIRRINAGDDTSVSPGYALHLVRMPVSILPGSKTRKGYGAEITVTATPYLGRDLLPTTFRTLVINDLIQQLATPLMEYFNSPSLRAEFEMDRKVLLAASHPETPMMSMGASGRPETSPARTSPILAARPRQATRPAGSTARMDPALLRTAQASQPSNPPTTLAPLPAAARQPTVDDYGQRFKFAWNASVKMSGNQGQGGHPMSANASPGDVTKHLASDISALVARAISSGPRSRNTRYAFPATQLSEVYGAEFIIPMAFQTYDVLLAQTFVDTNEPLVLQYQRVAGHLQDQITAAYDLLSRPENAFLWINHATPELARAVQARDGSTLASLRMAYLSALPNPIDQNSMYSPKDATPMPGDQWYTTTAAYSWAILVESVLLNERLIEDIKESASSKGGPMIVADQMPFFLPCPPDEARDAFNAYVKNRFPIHVFALDPVVQEQNLADQLSRSRELQFALSLAFVTGSISANSLTNFARRIELQTSTIAVNRTQIGFSHGDDTFGWRFQPRYQTPPIQNNLAAIAQVIGGGPTRAGDRRQLELEPGQRECVAIVIMPSFVPYVSFETRTNWYRLNSPKHSEIDPIKFLELSASIKRAFLLAEAVCDAGLYRDGDIARLVNRVKQLSAELPFQSMIQQVPYENTHGGFELFSNGTTDLAPELRSWYGAPGVSVVNGGSLYLVGNNFSVHETSIVVGNKHLISSSPTTPVYRLLSRQVIEVDIPPGCQTVMRGGKPYVEASVATPYGVSQPLYIPATDVTPSKPATPPNAPTFTWTTPLLQLAYKFDAAGGFEADTGLNADPTANPRGGLSIALDSGVDLNFNDKSPTTADLTLTFAPPFDKKVKPIEVDDVPYNPQTGAFEITDKRFLQMNKDLFDKDHFGKVFSDDPAALPQDATVARTVIRLKGAAAPLVPADVSNTLKIHWRQVTSKDTTPAPPTPAPSK